MDGLNKYNNFSELSGEVGNPSNERVHIKPRNIEKESRKAAGILFNPLLKRFFPKNYKEDKNIKEEKPSVARNEGLDRMGIVLSKEDLRLQDEVYTEIDTWRNELTKVYGNKETDARNKRELEIFEKNPYEWVKISLDKKIQKINKKDTGELNKSNRKKAIEEKLEIKRPLVERLNNIKLALEKKIPLKVDGEMRSEWVGLDNGTTLNVEIATDEINKLFNKDSLNYSVVGIVLRGREKFIVVKSEKGERVEIKMEDAERLEKETSVQFIKSKEKEKKLENIEVGDIVKIRRGGTSGERSVYKIREVIKGKVFFEDLGKNQKGSMSVEDMRSFLTKENIEFVVEKNEEYKNREALKSLEYFSEKIEELKIRQTIGRRNASPEERARIWKTQLAELGFGNVNIELAGQVDNQEEIEKQEEKKKARLETMKNIAEILRKNNGYVDKVVIHGYSFENEKGELLSHWDADTDTRGALYMLQLAGIRYGTIEKTHKGGKIEHKPGEVILYLDTGNKTLSVEHENGGVQIAFDHHQKEYPGEVKTCATKETYETMVAGGFIKREIRLDRLAEVVNQEDNLSYVDNKRFNKDYFKYKYASSLFALQKEVDFRHLIKWTKEGKDPFDPKFSPKELKELVRVLDTVDGEKKFIDVPLEAVIGKIQENVLKDVSAIAFAMRKMKERGIKTETIELGRVVYNFPDFQVAGKNKKYLNKFRYPFVAIKAFGYDTYASYSELTKKGFLNNSTHDLTFINENISEEIPGSNMINGVMILPPRTRVERNVGSEEKFLRATKLKE